MKTIQVSEASGPVLDWLVAKAEHILGHIAIDHNMTHPLVLSGVQAYGPSFIWSQGGPIMERERISSEWLGTEWCAKRTWLRHEWHLMHGRYNYGPTVLVAAMRCFVTFKLGDTVEVPEELL